MNEFRVPVLRSEKALSVGANTVKPWFDFLSWVLIRTSTWLLFSSPMNVVNLLAFWRTEMMSGGPEGPEVAGAGGED